MKSDIILYIEKLYAPAESYYIYASICLFSPLAALYLKICPYIVDRQKYMEKESIPYYLYI